jgi:hypothetical protein
MRNWVEDQQKERRERTESSQPGHPNLTDFSDRGESQRESDVPFVSHSNFVVALGHVRASLAAENVSSMLIDPFAKHTSKSAAPVDNGLPFPRTSRTSSESPGKNTSARPHSQRNRRLVREQVVHPRFSPLFASTTPATTLGISHSAAKRAAEASAARKLLQQSRRLQSQQP